MYYQVEGKLKIQVQENRFFCPNKTKKEKHWNPFYD